MTRNRWMMAAVALFAVQALSVAETSINVLLIGWDGARRGHVEKMLERNELPTLAALKAEGKMVNINVTTGATDTKAGWSQILTGYHPNTTGVHSNGKYQPIPKGYTIFERAEKAFGDDKVYTAMIVAKSGHVDAAGPVKVPYQRWKTRSEKGPLKNLPEQARLRRNGMKVIQEGARRFVVAPGKPYFNAKDGMDLFVNGLKTDEAVSTRTLSEIEKNKDKRFLIFAHFARPDHDGHQFGEGSKEYSAGLKEDDEWTGKIIKRLKEMNLYKDTTVYVVVDHGFDVGKTTHRNAPYVFMATNDTEVRRPGDRADIGPTVLKRLGIDIAKLEPPLFGKPLTER
jgi:predicted AlkP superfamily pyrophosphatase or phosphodiesterase